MGISIVLERVLGLVASSLVSCSFALIAFQIGLPLGFIVPIAVASLVAAGSLLFLTRSQSLRQLLKKVLRRFRKEKILELVDRVALAFDCYSGRWKLLLAITGLSVLEQLVPVLFFLAATLALGVSISMLALLISGPLALLLARVQSWWPGSECSKDH